MKLCSYNIEWFDDLFDSDNSLKTDPASKDRFNAIGTILQEISADIVCIIEAPNHMVNGQKKTIACLENFANEQGLSTTKALIGFASVGRQEVAVLYNPNKVDVSHMPGGSGVKNPPFNGRFEHDADGDGIKEIYKFFRPPLELEIKRLSDNCVYKLIAAHTKSKGIFSSSDMIHWELESKKNRRKLYAECAWIRNRVDEWLDKGSNVIVVGDINDGPGMDSYEFSFGKSAVEIIMGSIYEPEKILKSHIGQPKWGQYGWEPSSTSFKDRFTQTYINVLIDHILLSQGIEIIKDSHMVWNPFQNYVAKPLKEALLKASDHFPITIEFKEKD
ncbi:MAG: hypothetical protein KKE44_18520 [Proteobacteria bacterium]|nr:hypothetical protein [Pseudomonadota bacterium]MBU1584728.1 hypothetical protein [Pseudomonadota bacterium]MBU2452575.1 hypothetical protein [Pseudomonadota bacterium]MBU2629652.1 hypothetical protein [Pseudomonadota bacterium]